MKLKRTTKGLVTALLATLIVSAGVVFASESSPIELSADTIEYNSASDVAVAEGNVSITQDGGILKGAKAEYNLNTKKIVISGGVTVNKGDMHVVAGQLVAQDNQLSAEGNVLFTKGSNSLSGARVVYNQATKAIAMPNGGEAIGETAKIKGNRIVGNLGTNRYTATGNVYLYSKTNDFEATSQEASYVASGNKGFNFNAKGNVEIISSSRNLVSRSAAAEYNSENNGQLVLQGDAVVKQNNNTIKGKVLTVYLGKDIKIQ